MKHTRRTFLGLVLAALSLSIFAGPPLAAQLKSINRDGVITVAAADSGWWAKMTADFTCNGFNDDAKISAAVAAAYLQRGNALVDVTDSTPSSRVQVTNAGSEVRLLHGSYSFLRAVDLTPYTFGVKIKGSGRATIINQPSGDHAFIAAADATARGDGLTLQDFTIQNHPNGYHGIMLTNQAKVRVSGVTIQYGGLDGIAYLSNDHVVWSDDDDEVSPWSWVESEEGTGEYRLVYYNSRRDGQGIDHHLSKPATAVFIGGVSKTQGTPGSLAADRWGWGDSDGWGFDSLYIRMSDDGKPLAGEVEMNSKLVGQSIMENVEIRGMGRHALYLLGVHDTTINTSYLRQSAVHDIVLNYTANVHVTDVQFDGLTASHVVLKTVAGLRNRVASCMIEGAAEVDALSGSFFDMVNVGLTGSLTIAAPYSSGNSMGVYQFESINPAGLFSTTTAAARIHYLGGSAVLGNVTAMYFYANSVHFTTSGSDKVLRVKETAAVSDAGAFFTNCYFTGVTSNKIYTIAFDTEQFVKLGITGGGMRNFDLTIDGDTATFSRALIDGVHFRVSDLNILDILGVSITDNSFYESTSTTTIDNVDGSIVFSDNTMAGHAVTINDTCAANVVAVGNVGSAGTTNSVTSAATGTEAQSTNPGVTMTGF